MSSETSKKTAASAAKWAINMDVMTDASQKVALCKELNDSMYRDELYGLALDLGLSVNKSITKKELCQLITEFSLAQDPEEVDPWFYTQN